MKNSCNSSKMSDSVLETTDVCSARNFYSSLGIDTLPIAYGKKAPPLISSWPAVNSSEAWASVSTVTNIAIRCGGEKSIAIFDCDEAATSDIIIEALHCAGVNVTELPIVQSASGFGRHIYLSIYDPPKGNILRINPNIGLGDLRFDIGSYCLAPPSLLSDGGYYQLIQGSFTNIPQVTYAQVLQILRPIENDVEALCQSTSAKKKASWLATCLLSGEKITDYPSRSEAEYALMLSLLNSGFSRDEIYDLFQRYPCAGKFREKFDKNPKAGLQYFDQTFRNGKEYAATHESIGRQIAKSAKKRALSKPWPGRAGITDRDVFRAHAEIAHRSGKIVYGASSRELAEIANVGHITAANSTKRLVEQGLIVFIEPAKGKYPAKYKLNISRTLPQRKIMGECSSYVEHDAFSYFGLGKSSKQILDVLLSGPKTNKELADETGRHVNTIKKRLLEMERIAIDSSTGEILRLVRKEGDLWYLCEQHDLDEIARHLGTSGRMERRRQDYIEQRRLHNRGLELGKRLDQRNNTQ